jgi:hypothetical protein
MTHRHICLNISANLLKSIVAWKTGGFQTCLMHNRVTDQTSISSCWHLAYKCDLKFYYFTFKCWILLKPVLGAWTVACTFQYCPWTGSIKPSLQHFQFCRVGLNNGVRDLCRLHDMPGHHASLSTKWFKNPFMRDKMLNRAILRNAGTHTRIGVTLYPKVP